MANTDRLSMLERWADGMEKLEQYYEGKYGPPATPAQLPPITTYDAMLEAIADGMERAKRNINKKSPTYHSDSVAYAKTVPSGDVHYASLEQIGGKTVAWNQLAESSMFRSGTAVGLTVTHTDTSITASGQTSSTSNAYLFRGHLAGSHIFLVTGTPVPDNILLRLSTNGSTYTTVTENFIFTSNADSSVYTIVGIKPESSGLDVNMTWYLQLFDLTLMFGAGNEPTTYEEFQQIFPAVWYAYNPGTLLSAGVTEVVSKKADTTEIATYPIPAEVRALSGYGWSCPSHYNYIDFEAKKFIQNVASVDLSTLTWGYGPSVGWSATLNAKNPADDDTVFDGISATLTPVTRNAQATAFSGGTDAGMVSVAGGKVYVGTGDIGIVPSGTLYYELATPIETDISAYLTDDNLIEVESGGTLSFPNSNGDDYRINVPSSVTFVVGEP